MEYCFMAKKGRPCKYVTDPNGRPIVGLSCYNGRYYASHSKPRKWFSSDFKESLMMFQRFLNQQKEEEPVVEIYIPHDPEIPSKNGFVEWDEIGVGPAVISAAYPGDTTCLPEILFLEKAREIILTDPILAAKKLGIPELSRLDDLPRLEKPLALKSMLEFYINHKKPSKDERRKVKSVFKAFMNVVGVRTIREITSDMIFDYRDKCLKEYQERGLSYHWLNAKFAKAKTVLNCSAKHGRSNKSELNRVLGWCKCLTVSKGDTTESAQPIEREDVHKLLNCANLRMRTIMLLALNCGYYAKDIHDIKKTMIKHKKGLDYVVFPREKNKHMRVNVLWEETKSALDEYMKANPNELEYVFSSQNGTPFDPHDVQRCFDRLRKKANVSDEVKFSHFRDGAATALFGKVNSDMLQVTIGHRIKGEKSKYISVKPEQVADCAEYIREEYFG